MIHSAGHGYRARSVIRRKYPAGSRTRKSVRPHGRSWRSSWSGHPAATTRSRSPATSPTSRTSSTPAGGSRAARASGTTLLTAPTRTLPRCGATCASGSLRRSSVRRKRRTRVQKFTVTSRSPGKISNRSVISTIGWRHIGAVKQPGNGLSPVIRLIRICRFASHCCRRANPEPAERAHTQRTLRKFEARQPSWSRMRRALASIRFSPADRPRLSPARSRTTSTTWTRSPNAKLLQVRLIPLRPIASIVAATGHGYTSADLEAPREQSSFPRMTPTGHAVMPRTESSTAGTAKTLATPRGSAVHRELSQPRTRADGEARYGEQPDPLRARANTRRSARQTVAEPALQHSRQNGSYASWGRGHDSADQTGLPRCCSRHHAVVQLVTI